MVSFVHPGKNSLVSFGSGVFCPTFGVSSEVENIFISFVAKEQMKYTCFSLHEFFLMHWE